LGILQSRLFTDANNQCLNDDLVDDASKERIRRGQLDVTQRLELAATVDPQHILSPQKGPHVRMIHRALIRLRNARPITADGSNMPQEVVDAFNLMIQDLRKAHPISDTELKSSTYGATTAALVKAYKVSRDIRRTPASAVDHVVGIQTTRSLDADLMLAEGGGLPPPPRPAPPGLPQDIFIRFNPIDNLAQEGQPDPVRFQLVNQRFNTEAYRLTHRELRIITFFGGRGTKDPTDQAVRIASLTRSSAAAGNTIIVGASAGGFSVLNTAFKLTALGIPIRFVGIADGGFFVDSNDIERFGSPPAFASPPTIRLPGPIKADETLNVFQTLGIEALSKKSAPNDRGIAPGAEWFGEMTGFNNQRLTPQNNSKLRTLKVELALLPGADLDRTLVIRKKLFSDPAHIEAVREGEVRIGGVVDRLLLVKPG
jgi:hypothetical protein